MSEAVPRRPELVRDSSWLASSDVLAILLGLVGQAFLAKSLLRSDFGLMVVVIDAFVVMFLLVDAGLPTIITRDVPRAPSQCRSLVMQTFRIQAILAAIMAPIGFIIALKLWPDASLLLLGASGGIAILHVFTYAPRSALRALGEARKEAIVKLVERVSVTFGYGFLTFRDDGDPAHYAMVFFLGVAASLLYALIAVTRLWSASGEQSKTKEKENILLPNKALLLSALPFAITLGVIPLIGRLEKLLLSWYHSTEEVAVFHVAFLAYMAGLTLPQAIRAAMLPILGELRGNKIATIAEIRKARRIILWLIPIGLVGGAIVVNLLMLLAFGDYIKESFPLFLILLIGWVFTMLSAPNYVAVQAGERPWNFTLMLFIGVGLAAVSAVILIPTYGVLGAAISSVCGAITLAITALFFSGEFSSYSGTNFTESE